MCSQGGTKAFEAILSRISNDPRVTIDELVTLTGISRRQVLRYVKELTEDEVIRRDGGRKLGKILVKFCASETTCLICHVSSLSRDCREMLIFA